MARVNLIDPIRQENLTSFVRSSAVSELQVKHNTVYFSSNGNHLSGKQNNKTSMARKLVFPVFYYI